MIRRKNRKPLSGITNLKYRRPGTKKSGSMSNKAGQLKTGIGKRTKFGLALEESGRTKSM
jgi:hypothetical protein